MIKKRGDYGDTHNNFNKNKFKDHMLQFGTEKDFSNFKPLINEIRCLLDNSS